jgi:hypothetical protein
MSNGARDEGRAGAGELRQYRRSRAALSRGLMYVFLYSSPYIRSYLFLVRRIPLN